ncbi:MAG: hypothetical protein M9890_05415 [Thermomicrobiales bacterium]|nr:hypothetical protein [Thermomicrobiales bacterium]
MTGRKCSTCKHYEPAPIWRRGWCRNPVLYAPQQNHLVFEDDLDCERGMGNYWEPADATGQIRPFIPLRPVFADQADANRIISTRGGQPIYSVSGSSGYSNDPDDDYPPMDDEMDESRHLLADAIWATIPKSATGPITCESARRFWASS